VQIWNKTVGDNGKWTLELVKRLDHPVAKDRSQGFAPIMAVLPMTQNVFVGDDDGRVVSYDA